MRLSLHAPALIVVALAGCKKDAPCTTAPASFTLDVTLSPADSAHARTLRVEVESGASGWRRDFDLAGKIDDGRTSASIVLEPAPSSAFDLTARAIVFDEKPSELARGENSIHATADGCNRMSIAANAAPSIDGGVSDASRDDGYAPDALPRDAADAAGADAIPDAMSPDAESPDVMVPADSGPPAFVGPSPNFDPAPLNPVTELVVDCGSVVFDSSQRTFDRQCGPSWPTATTQPQGGANPDLTILPVTRLHIAVGSELLLRGNQPVVIAVFGQATIDGELDASASLQAAGPGAIGELCSVNWGADAPNNGGGGGGGGFGSAGGRGGITNVSGGAAVVDRDLEPLRAGCPGGLGHLNALRAAAGGAVQVSASRSLSIGATGAVLAGGGGGSGGQTHRGGGGGGSGGAILLDAPSIRIDGLVLAHGGSGAGGGPNDQTLNNGTNGDDGSALMPQGGPGGGGEGGTGGGGATASRVTAEAGGVAVTAGGGGGGGGGGAGVVRVRSATCVLAPTARIFPPATCP